MRIIKRNGSEEDFNIEKIINAVKKANGSGEHKFLTDEQIEDVADYVEYSATKSGEQCPLKKFGIWLRISSWQRVRLSLQEDMCVTATTARLFVRQTLPITGFFRLLSATTKK